MWLSVRNKLNSSFDPTLSSSYEANKLRHHTDGSGDGSGGCLAGVTGSGSGDGSLSGSGSASGGGASSAGFSSFLAFLAGRLGLLRDLGVALAGGTRGFFSFGLAEKKKETNKTTFHVIGL